MKYLDSMWNVDIDPYQGYMDPKHNLDVVKRFVSGDTSESMKKEFKHVIVDEVTKMY